MSTAYVQPGSSARVWLRRFFLLLVTAASVLQVALNGRWLLAEAYATYARENIERRGNGTATLASAELAVRLEPRDANYLSLLARAERRQGDGQNAERLYQAALRRAPANAMIWRDYALLRVSQREFDHRLEHAVGRVQALSPANRGMQMGLAVTGLTVWSESSPALRQLWRRSINSRLKLQPKTFLRYVFAAGREATLCDHFAHNVALKRWCYWSRNARRTCYRPDLPARQVRACEQLGAYLGRAP